MHYYVWMQKYEYGIIYFHVHFEVSGHGWMVDVIIVESNRLVSTILCEKGTP